jgi:site-specific DNA-methyltransferase (adenine-specific)
VTPYYEDESVTLFHADCLDVFYRGPQFVADHVITDPPYEAEAHTKGRRAVSHLGGGPNAKGIAEERPIGFAAITDEERRLSARWMRSVTRKWILVFCQVEAAMIWRDALAPAKYARTQIWRKPDSAPQFTGDRPGMGYESIVTCWNGDGRMSWNGGGRHGVYEHCVNDFGRLTGDRPHPTMKPEPLMCELVSLFTDPGDLILDPFGGSGTTAVAAKRLGRRCILIEREEKYCEVAAKRLRQGALDLFSEQPA